VDTLNQRAKLSFVSDCFTRALRPRQMPTLTAAALRGTHRKDLRRGEAPPKLDSSSMTSST
jgi:hypothetical protein